MTINIYAIPGLGPLTLEQAIFESFNVHPDQLLIKTRKRQIVEARQFYFYMKVLQNNFTGYSELERETGFDHSTIIYAVNSVRNLLDFDKSFRNKANLALSKITTT